MPCSNASPQLEGHGDNAAAALLGGLAICAPGRPGRPDGRSDELRAVLFIPDTPFTTHEARQVVPDPFSRADAIFNASRCALLVARWQPGIMPGSASRCRIDGTRTRDSRLCPARREVVEAANDAGASGAALAGAGPSVIALTPLDGAVVAAMAGAAAEQALQGRRWCCHRATTGPAWTSRRVTRSCRNTADRASPPRSSCAGSRAASANRWVMAGDGGGGERHGRHH